MKFRVRFNKSAGHIGRGSEEHKWRVFDETGKEWLCKEVVIEVHSWTEADPNGNDWNFACEGQMKIVKETSTIFIISL
jgi:hypothetical protein